MGGAGGVCPVAESALMESRSSSLEAPHMGPPHEGLPSCSSQEAQYFLPGCAHPSAEMGYAAELLRWWCQEEVELQPSGRICIRSGHTIRTGQGVYIYVYVLYRGISDTNMM